MAGKGKGVGLGLNMAGCAGDEGGVEWEVVVDFFFVMSFNLPETYFEQSIIDLLQFGGFRFFLLRER